MDKKEFQKAVGRRIKAIRLNKEIPQQRLASECDFEKGNMARIEGGGTNMTIWTLYKIATALEVEPQELLSNIE